LNELIAQNQALHMKVQKTMEAMVEYQSQNAQLKQTIERQKQDLHEANTTKQEMKNIVDSLLYQHQLLAAAMSEKPNPTPQSEVKVVAPKKSRKKKQPIKRKPKKK
jgi:small-conductance mechanosensitive channel